MIAALMVASDIGLWQLFLRPLAPAAEKATPRQMALPLPDTPSIGVLERQVSAMCKAGLPGALGLKTAAPAVVRKAGDRPDVDTLAGAVRRFSLQVKPRAIGAPAVADDILLKLRNTNRRINKLPAEFFKNSGMKTALANRLNAAMTDVGNEQYQAALRRLDADVLPRMDGCAQTRRPDENDWVVTCAAQEKAYFLLTEAIDMLEDLM